MQYAFSVHGFLLFVSEEQVQNRTVREVINLLQDQFLESSMRINLKRYCLISVPSGYILDKANMFTDEALHSTLFLCTTVAHALYLLKNAAYV